MAQPQTSLPLRSLARSSSSRSTARAEPDTAPDGGPAGWLVVAGCTTFFFVVLGLIYSFGIVQAELAHRGVASSATLGWLASLSVVLSSVFALPFTALVARIGNARSGLVAALCVGGGYVLLSYALHALPLLFAAQALVGVGYGLMFAACSSLATQYFVRRRGLAGGIVYAGSGVGGAVLAVGLSRLARAVGLAWAIRIYGLLALAVLVPASWLLKHRVPPPLAMVRMSYLRQTNFLLLLAATATVTFSLFVPPFFLPTFAVSAGYTAETGAWLVAGYNLASALGRIMFGFLADSRFGPISSLALSMLLMGASILGIWSVSDSLAALISFLIINGAAAGALLSLMPIVNASLFGVQETVVTMSMLTMSRAIGSGVGSPAAGYLLDAFGGAASGTRAYRPALLLVGSVSLLSAGFVCTLRWRLGGLDLKKRV
ncbi:MFS general substrate transporter [Tilletiopsis washingtonensis]|uniref:MFS general substrate transporter n=1 Tax=Tilletiopsis washingtonensis TaxID=58919 RepID=A0A316Z8F4_9BASI|nr:MFS general substrate transporter [Tilletiopsis washingtonensis]PWN97536.1 MFS general substrate transporter [Tilletiopsis washingtonensis]